MTSAQECDRIYRQDCSGGLDRRTSARAQRLPAPGPHRLDRRTSRAGSVSSLRGSWTRNPESDPMDNHLYSATTTLTLFASEASANGKVTAAQRRIEELAARLGLDRARLSALHAVMTWAAFLRPSTEPRDRE